MIFFVVNGNVKEATLWFVSEARCHFLQPGAVLAACWHSQESGFQPGPAVQTVCLSWLAQGHPCSEKARPSLTSCPQPVPTAGFAACAQLLLCRRNELYSPICICFCASRIAAWVRLRHAKVSKENGTSKASNITPQNQETGCRIWVWLRAAMPDPATDLWHFLLQHLFGLSRQRRLLISMIIVGCLLLLNCAKIHSSGKSTLIKLRHLKLSAVIATTWVQWQRATLSYHIFCLWAGRRPLPPKAPFPHLSCSTWPSAAKGCSSQPQQRHFHPMRRSVSFAMGHYWVQLPKITRESINSTVKIISLPSLIFPFYI